VPVERSGNPCPSKSSSNSGIELIATLLARH
jgi:hypothetical protein